MDVAPAEAEARPAGQSVGWLAFEWEYFPGLQMLHIVNAELEYQPASHTMHPVLSLRPTTAEAVPDGHGCKAPDAPSQ